MRTTRLEKVDVLRALYQCAGKHLWEAKDYIETDAEHLADFTRTNTSGRGAAEVLNVAVAFGRHGDMERLVQDIMLLDEDVRESVALVLERCSVWEVFCSQVPSQAFRIYFKKSLMKPIVTKPPIVPGAPIEQPWSRDREVMKDILSRPEALVRN